MAIPESCTGTLPSVMDAVPPPPLGCLDVMGTVVQYLTVRDNAQLEQTCLLFATRQVEMRRRLVIAAPLRSIDRHVTGAVHGFLADLHTDRTVALRSLIRTALCASESSTRSGSLPAWLQTMLLHANVELSATIESIVADIQSRKRLLRALAEFMDTTYPKLCQLETFAVQDDLLTLYRNDYDGAAARLVCLEDDGSPRRANALRSWYRLVVGHGERLQYRLARGDFVLEQLASIGRRFLPCSWPHERLPVSNSHHEDIDKYWNESDPRLCEQWKALFVHVLEWVDQIEPCVRGDAIAALQFLLVKECAASCGEDTVPLGVTTLAIFLLKKSLIQHTTARIKRQVRESRASFARLVEELCEMVRLYKVIYPLLVSRREVALSSMWNWA